MIWLCWLGELRGSGDLGHPLARANLRTATTFLVVLDSLVSNSLIFSSNSVGMRTLICLCLYAVIPPYRRWKHSRRRLILAPVATR